MVILKEGEHFPLAPARPLSAVIITFFTSVEPSTFVARTLTPSAIFSTEPLAQAFLRYPPRSHPLLPTKMQVITFLTLLTLVTGAAVDPAMNANERVSSPSALSLPPLTLEEAFHHTS